MKKVVDNDSDNYAKLNIFIINEEIDLPTLEIVIKPEMFKNMAFMFVVDLFHVPD